MTSIYLWWKTLSLETFLALETFAFAWHPCWTQPVLMSMLYHCHHKHMCHSQICFPGQFLEMKYHSYVSYLFHVWHGCVYQAPADIKRSSLFMFEMPTTSQIPIRPSQNTKYTITWLSKIKYNLFCFAWSLSDIDAEFMEMECMCAQLRKTITRTRMHLSCQTSKMRTLKYQIHPSKHRTRSEITNTPSKIPMSTKWSTIIPNTSS